MTELHSGLIQKKNDAFFRALSSGETQASFPALFKQESGSFLSLTAHKCAFSCRSSAKRVILFCYEVRVADHHSATLILWRSTCESTSFYFVKIVKNLKND